jgi:two-component system sensor histidine kinase VicK
MDMQMAKTDLREAVKSAIQSMRIDAEGHGLTLTDDLPESLPPVYGDKGRILQVIINIISNAVKYNRKNGSITVSGGSEGDSVFISVADTGLGIPKEDLPHIFDRFYRVDKARSRKMGGTGLGLAIAKEIVEAHGGHISFDSVYGKGSTVTVFLPVYSEDKTDG